MEHKPRVFHGPALMISTATLPIIIRRTDCGSNTREMNSKAANMDNTRQALSIYSYLSCSTMCLMSISTLQEAVVAAAVEGEELHK